MPLIALEGVEIFYEWSGSEDLPVLMLSNSLGTDRTMWSAQMPFFEKYFRVLRYDSRGHGKSSVPVGQYTIEQMGVDVLRLLNALEVQRVNFCGLSLGGMVGQWLGIHAEDRLLRLVLCNTAAKIGTAAGWNERIQAVEEFGMEAILPTVIERWFTASFRDSHPEEVTKIGAILKRTDAAGYCASCAAIREMDQCSEIVRIALPVLVVCGTEDAVTSCIASNALLSSIAGSRLLRLFAAHLSNVEQAEQFTCGVLGFLQGESEASEG